MLIYFKNPFYIQEKSWDCNERVPVHQSRASVGEPVIPTRSELQVTKPTSDGGAIARCRYQSAEGFILTLLQKYLLA